MVFRGEASAASPAAYPAGRAYSGQPDLPWEKLRRVVAASFLHRRKTLLNALLLAGYDKEKITTAINTLRWQPTIRPEEISPQEYVCLTRQLERLV